MVVLSDVSQGDKMDDDKLPSRNELIETLERMTRAFEISPFDKLARQLGNSPLDQVKFQIDGSLLDQMRGPIEASPFERMMQNLIPSSLQDMLRDHEEKGVRKSLLLAGTFANSLDFEHTVQKLAEVRDLLREGNTTEAESSFVSAINSFTDTLETIPTRVEARALFSLFSVFVFPLLLFIYSEISSDLRFDELESRLVGMREEQKEAHNLSSIEHSIIFEALNNLANVVDQTPERTAAYQYYVVERMTPLTPIRHYTARRLMTLMPGQEVELLERAGKWIKVEAYDIVEERVVQGWALKKYLRRAD